MATLDQVDAGEYFAKHTRYYIKRTTQKAVILHCADPNQRVRIGKREAWVQRRIISRKDVVWVDHQQLRLTVPEMAARMRKARATAAGMATV